MLPSEVMSQKKKPKNKLLFVFHDIVGILALQFIKIKHGKEFREEIKLTGLSQHRKWCQKPSRQLQHQSFG